jgi:hypothetical protein
MENLSLLFKSKNSVTQKTQCLYLFEVFKYLKYVWKNMKYKSI